MEREDQIEDRFEVTISRVTGEKYVRFASLEDAYAYYLTVKGEAAEVGLHDLDNNVTITDNSYGSDQ